MTQARCVEVRLHPELPLENGDEVLVHELDHEDGRWYPATIVIGLRNDESLVRYGEVTDPHIRSSSVWVCRDRVKRR